MAAANLELCKGQCAAKAVLPVLDLAQQVRNKVTPDWGQVTGKGLLGVTFGMDGCYWLELCKGHCAAKAVLPFLDLAR